jgi:hypothetical protein
MAKLATALVSCAMLFASGSVAHATSNITCKSPDNAASLDLVIGRLPILSVVNGGYSIEGASFGIEATNGTTVVVGQAHDDGSAIRIDFTDPNVENVVASIRLFTAFENERFAQAGVIIVPGRGAWPMVCEEQ